MWKQSANQSKAIITVYNQWYRHCDIAPHSMHSNEAVSLVPF